MLGRVLIFTLVMLGIGSPLQADTATCGDLTRCLVEHGYYLVHAPAGWDGKSRLPTVLYLHGRGETAEDAIGNAAFMRFADEAGLLFVAGNGEGKVWSFPGSPGHNRDELAYLTTVLDDVAKRYPVNSSRLWASGFSQGGSMVWYAACNMAQRFVAFAPVSGDFWRPMPTECHSGPVDLRHVHGTADETVPLRGRSLDGGLYRQADLGQSLDVLRGLDHCKPAWVSEPGEDGTRCDRFTQCDTGRSLQVCFHDGKQVMNVAYLRAAWNWIMTLPATPR